MSRAPFIGIGPGRCGTDSLAKIVGACRHTDVTHEQFHSRWYAHDPILDELVEKMESCRYNEVVCGEVQCQIGSHVGYLRRKVPDMKVVCMHRDKDAVVRSYMGGFKPMFRPFDKVHYYDGNPTWPDRYPIIDAANSEQAFEFWWEMYEGIMREIPDPVLHFECEWFNDDAKVHELLDFLEIPEGDRIIPEKRKWNSLEERRAEARVPAP